MSSLTGESISANMDWFHWGVIISVALFGVNAMQAWIYFNNNNDRWYLRLFVTVLILMDLATACLDSAVLRYYSEKTYGVPLGAIPTAITLDIQEMLTLVVVFMVQVFMASRIYLLGCGWFAPIIIVGCGTGAFISHTLFIASNIMDNPVMHLSAKELKIEIAVSLCLTATADLVATAVLCQRLSSSSKGVQRTRSVVYRLILYFITRGILVTINQFLGLIIFEIKPVSLYWIPFEFIMCRLYVNTTLAILNSRISLRTHLDPDITPTNMSKFTPPIMFENHSTSPSLDVEAQTQTTTMTTVHDEM